jgi:uncharacterized protein
MTNFIPIFPLNIVVYPGERLNLHIFEPRYKQLIKECIVDNKMFGIPCVTDGKVEEYGTLMEIVELAREYDNGEMDIVTRGTNIFRILEVVRSIPDKLYQGAIVNYPENVVERGNTEIGKLIVEEVKRLYSLLNVEEKFPIDEYTVISYGIAHFVGLTIEQEYELLGLFTELHRLEYLRRHLNTIIPVVKELEEVKARVKMNGHFRNLSLGDFNL